MSPWLAAALGALCFASSVGNSFAYDDRALIVRNPRVRSLADVRGIWLSDWWQVVEHAPADTPQRDRLYRPLSMFTFALNYAVQGYRPAGYHLVNLLLHAAACFLVWHLARRLADDAAVAALAAAIFAVHPIHAEAVANVVGRAEILATLFLLGGLLVLLPRSGELGLKRAVWAAPFFFLALLSKETAVCYPAVVGLLLYATRGRRRRGWPWWAVQAACLLVPLLAYLPLRYVALEHQLFRAVPVDVLMNPLVTATGLQRVWAAFTVLGHYARLLVVPAQLSCDYGIAIVDPRHGFTLMTLAGVLAAGGIVVGLVGFRQRSPLWRRVAILTAISLASYALISNTALLIGVAVAERLFYWPSVPLCVLAGVGVAEFWRWQSRVSADHARHARLLRVLGALLLAALGLRTAVRNADWATNMTLFTEDVAAHPEGAHLNKALGLELIKLWHDPDAPSTDLAVRWEAARRDLSRLGAWRDDWTLNQKQEALLRASEWHLNRALEIHPGYADALAARGRVRAQLGDLDAAMLDTEAALQLDPGQEDARQTLVQLLYGGEADRRAAELEQQVAEHPQDPELRLELGRILMQSGRYPPAQEQLERAVALAPDNALALRRLAEVLTLRQERSRAIGLFEKVLALTPDDWEAHANLVTLLAQHDPAAALQHAERAYSLKPSELRNSINLAEAYALNGRKSAAVDLLQRVAQKLDTDDPLRSVVSERLAVLRQR